MRMPSRRPFTSITSFINIANPTTKTLAALIVISSAIAASMAVTVQASRMGSFGSLLSVVSGNVTSSPPAQPSETTAKASSMLVPLPQGSAGLNSARRGHTATRLSDGRVLIAGGENSSEQLSGTEIFDPSSGTFSNGGNMSAARAYHAAIKLGDGRVLITGGRDGSGALSTTEYFDPSTGTFSSGPAMSVARAGHSATLLADGRVFIAGGNTNGSAEIFDPSFGTFIAISAQMNSARSKHSAALLLDGRVLLVGGESGDELAGFTAEIFDPASSSFSTVGAALVVARVLPHLHVLFDGKVQIIGGSDDGSMEIYDPVVQTIGAYAHVLPESDPCVNFPSYVLASQTRAALFHNGQSDALKDRSGHTISELPGINRAVVAGGINSSGSVLSTAATLNSSPASITTDKLDYAPGETVNLTGRGWQPGETVRVMIHEDPHTPQERGFDAQADANGNISGTYLVQDYDLAMKFIVGARGLSSGWTAQTTFTDGNARISGIVRNAVTNAPIAGASVFCSSGCAGGTTTNGAGFYSFQFTFPTNGPVLVQITAAATGFLSSSASFVVNNGDNFNQNFFLTPIVRTTATTVSCTPNPTVVGGDVTCTATVIDTASGAPTPPSGTVNLFSSGPGTFNPSASCTLAPVNASTSNCSRTYTPNQRGTGTHNITATYVGSAQHSGSTSPPFALTVDKGNTTTTITADNPDPSVVGQPYQVDVTVAPVAPAAGTPGGAVAVDDGNGNTCNITLSGGSGSCLLTSTSAGPKTITASYGGDSNFNGSSDTEAHQVNTRATNTTLTLSPSTINEGGSSTVTATVTDVEAAGLKSSPTGNVTFSSSDPWDTFSPNTCVLVPINSFSSSCSTTVSTADNGAHTITGNYAGSTVHSPSSGNAVLNVMNVNPSVGPISALPSGPQPIGTTITFNASFTDPGTRDTHTALWSWDDGTTSTCPPNTSGCTLNETNGSGTVTASHTFSAAGVYKITLTVTDDDGGSGESSYEYVVIFDPSAGFVTGGGWIMSPLGASTLYPTATGKANFGFVSKYRRGSNTPEGQTEFQFKAGDINFHSSAYDFGSLVVSGHKAQYKGSGALNGDPGYKFVLTAYDGQAPGGGGVDRFRMKITKDDVVIYDNRMGASDDIDSADPLAISGGSIVIHK